MIHTNVGLLCTVTMATKFSRVTSQNTSNKPGRLPSCQMCVPIPGLPCASFSNRTQVYFTCHCSSNLPEVIIWRHSTATVDKCCCRGHYATKHKSEIHITAKTRLDGIAQHERARKRLATRPIIEVRTRYQGSPRQDRHKIIQQQSVVECFEGGQNVGFHERDGCI